MPVLNIPETTLDRALASVGNYFERKIRLGADFRTIRTPFLWSAPGVGKSQGVKQLCRKLENNLGIEIELRTYMLSHITIFELLGLMKEKDGSIMEIEPPFYKEEVGKYYLYFLDELDKTVNRQIRAAVLQIILEHKFWNFHLPRNTMIISAGNPENFDGMMYSNLSPELNNRFRHYLISPSFDTWKEWAVTEGNVNQYVLAFLREHEDYLYAKDAGVESAVFPTPRSWIAVSDYLNEIEMTDGVVDFNKVYIDIAADLGTETALPFIESCRQTERLPRTEDIILGKDDRVPRNHDQKYAVVESLIAYIQARKTETFDWDNICSYINQFEQDFASSFYNSILSLNIKDKMGLVESPVFRLWRIRHPNCV